MRRRTTPLVLAFALVVGLTLNIRAQATVLFEQIATSDSSAFFVSSPLTGNGESPGTRRADAFQLSQDAVVRDLHWWGQQSHKYVTGGYTLVDSYDFSFTIYADNSGKPGAVYHQTTGSLLYEPGTLNDLSWDRYFSSQLTTPFAVQAGVTYWLSIYSELADHSWSWQSVASSTTEAHTYTRTGGSPSWVSNPANLAFRVTGDFAAAPEPTTLALFGLGLAGLAAVRRRRTVS